MQATKLCRKGKRRPPRPQFTTIPDELNLAASSPGAGREERSQTRDRCSQPVKREAVEACAPCPATLVAHGGSAGSGLHRASAGPCRRVGGLQFWCHEKPCRRSGMEGRRRLILSIGQCAMSLQAVTTEAGILPKDELESCGWGRQPAVDVRHAACTPGMEITGGSPGQGLDDFAVAKA